MPVDAREDSAHPLPRDGWRTVVTGYQQPSRLKSGWQLLNTLVPFAVCWTMAYRLLGSHRALSFAFCVLATGFLLRIYIIQHDCGHRSFFKSAVVNDALGCALGVVTLLPYFRWRYDHAVHHAASGNLGRRGTGDVWTMTVREYAAADARARLRYRLVRSPLVLFGLGPLFLFVVWQRFTDWTRTARETFSVRATNVAIAGVVGLAGHFLGWAAFFAVQGPITWMGSTIAVWLFYVQHQFERTYWARPEEWDHATSAVAGASWLKLPALLRWFTGNIGVHHVHHLSPKIPNYELQRCVDENPMLQSANAVTLWEGLRSVSLKVWDEDSRRLLTWREAGVPPLGLGDVWDAVGGRRDHPRTS